MKKVAVLTDGWANKVTQAWFQGAKQHFTLHEFGIDLYVFHSFGNFSKDEKYNAGEYNIFRLPDFTQFDGVILDIASISSKTIADEIAEKIRSSHTPAVSLQIQIPGFYFSGIDNYIAMQHIVEHLIMVHGCRTINFAGGPPDNKENLLRFAAYKDTLEKYHIPFEPERAVQNSFELDSGLQAFDYFHERQLKADAIVCANDNTAVGFALRAKEYGFRIPEDFIVTGFDNLDKASYFDPRISTVGFEKEDLMYNALQLLRKIWDGQTDSSSHYADIHYFFQDSCGCTPLDPPDRGQHINEQIADEMQQMRMRNWMADLKRQFLDCTSYTEMFAKLQSCLYPYYCEKVYLLLNSDVFETQLPDFSTALPEDECRTIGYPSELTVVYSGQEWSTFCPDQQLFSLCPSSGNRDIFVFSPLHFREREVGCLIFKNCDHLLSNQFLFDTLDMFQNMMEALHSRLILRKMNQTLSQLYIRDSLTGLYNRMAYEKLALPLFSQSQQSGSFCGILFADVDRLKTINDSFGHDMGNLAISTVASALKQCCPSDSIVMRYGGDEFVCLIPDCSEVLLTQTTENLHVFLQQLASMNMHPFLIDASIGAILTDDSNRSLDDYIHLADQNMYLEKKARKAERKTEKKEPNADQ